MNEPTLSQLEELFQQQFNREKLEFESLHIVRITVVRYYGVSVSTFQDKFTDTPDPYFELRCPRAKHCRKFITTVKRDQVDREVNETFQFVIGHDQLDAEFPCRISLYDDDPITPDDFLGQVTIDLTELPYNEQIEKKIEFGHHGTGIFRFYKLFKENADFRLGLGLNEEEILFRKKRFPKIAQAIEKLIGKNKSPQYPEEAPVISLIGSGGGYRALTGMVGAQEALNEAGITDTLMYNASISGSAWYFTTMYALQLAGLEKQNILKDHLRQALGHDLKSDILSASKIKQYCEEHQRTKGMYRQPCSVVDFFGFSVGEALLGDHNSTAKLSEIKSYIEDAEKPFPLFISIHVKNNVAASEFSAYVENSPIEINLPAYGIGIEPSKFGSVWNQGYLARKCPEFLLHFYQGCCGCAFAVLIKDYIENGNENSIKYNNYIESLRENQSTSEGGVRYSPLDEVKEFVPQTLQDLILENDFFRTRNRGIGRTGLIFNVVRNIPFLNFFPLNPFQKSNEQTGQKKKIVEMFGKIKPNRISQKTKVISVVDAGLLTNVCTESVMRPQRQTDLVLVMDYNSYESDSSFNYTPLLKAAKDAWMQGIQFPSFDFKEVINMEPKELYVIEGENDDVPTVMWFTLCNTKFKQLKNYKPRRINAPQRDPTRPYNDFPVYDKGNPYSIFEFQYEEEDFDKLNDLMYFNVMSNIEEVKRQIEKATARKKRRLERIKKEDPNCQIQ